MKTAELEVQIPDGRAVSALFAEPDGQSRFLYVLGHGAGAGMRHPFLDAVATGLAELGIATLRYQFPYMEIGRKSPDSPRVLEASIRGALSRAAEIEPSIPVVAGGKSMGGRISSHVAAVDAPPYLRGLIFLGYPLHAPNKPDTKRAKHLAGVAVPMLFVQGTRDSLADLSLIRSTVDSLGSKATLHVVDGGDHSFKVLKRSGRTSAETMNELTQTISGWAKRELQV